MKTEELVITKEVISISGASPDIERLTRYDMKLSTDTDTFVISNLSTVELLRDYNNNYCDYIIVSFQMPLGDFIKQIYPKRDSLHVILNHQTLGSVVVEKLDFVLSEIDRTAMDGTLDSKSMNELNRTFINLTGQCLNKTIMELRDSTTHGLYKDVTVSDVINNVLSKELNIFGGIFGMGNGGITMVPPDNERKYDRISIVKGTRILDVPKYLQKGVYGVYNGGITTYLQAFNGKESLYIAPLYRQNLYGYFTKSLYIVAAQRESVTTLDSTYVVDGNVIKIIVARDQHISDDDANIKNEGTGFIATEANSLTSRPVQISKDKMKISEDFVTTKFAHKKVNGKIGPVASKGVSSNFYDGRTDGLIRDGILIQVNWKSSNTRLLSPMMPISYVIEVDGKIKKYEGVLHRVDSITDVPNETENSVLTIFVRKGKSKPSIKSKIKVK